MNRSLFHLPIFAAAALTASAFAAGPTLINQATVQAAGGFPYAINQSGSYQLSSDLIAPCGSADGIDITAAHVTLDLNGFTLSCAVANSFNGITIVGVTDVTIQNGSITGFGGAKRSPSSPVAGAGISFQSLLSTVSPFVGKVDRVRLTGNGDGVDGGYLSYLTVVNCVIDANLGNGINATYYLSVEDSDVSANNQNGIVINAGTVNRNQIGSNDASGIAVNVAATIVNNYIGSNGAYGMGGVGGTAPSSVGFGSNSFFLNNLGDVQATSGFVSMNNNASSFVGLF